MSEQTDKSQGSRPAAGQRNGRQTWLHFSASFLASLVAKFVTSNWIHDAWDWLKEQYFER